MKLFNIENGERVIYVQLDDIGFVYHMTDLVLPEEAENRIEVVDNHNRNNFERFVDPEIIDFFENLDFVLDFDLVKEFTAKDFVDAEKEFITESDIIANQWNFMTSAEQEKNCHLYERNRCILHKREHLVLISKILTGEEIIPFPDFVKINRIDQSEFSNTDISSERFFNEE